MLFIIKYVGIAAKKKMQRAKAMTNDTYTGA